MHDTSHTPIALSMKQALSAPARTYPVDWYSWGEEALARAKQEQKPILLSIGYLRMSLVPRHGTRIL